MADTVPEVKTEVPLKAELVKLLGAAQALYLTAAGSLTALEARLAEGYAPKDQPPVKDLELAYHALVLDSLASALPEITKQVNRCLELNGRRFRDAMQSEGDDDPSEGIMLLGHAFKLEQDVGPLVPSKSKEPEKHAAFLAWLKTSEYAGGVFENVHFNTVKDIVNDRLARGLPLPPHVGMFTKFKVKVKVSR